MRCASRGGQGVHLAADEQLRRRAPFVRLAPGHARERMAQQRGRRWQVPLDLDARARIRRRLHLAGAAVQGDEASEPVAQAVGVVHAQCVERGDHALHRRRRRSRPDPPRAPGRGRDSASASSASAARVSTKSPSSSAADGARMPIENVRQASSATPWCGTPGGRYSMSPGSSTQSCVGLNSLQQLQLDIVAERQGRRALAHGLGGIDLPAPAPLRLQQEHVVLVHVRADRAAGRGKGHHDVVDAPARQEVERLQQRATSASHLSTSCTSSVQSWRGMRGEPVLGEGAGAQDPAVAPPAPSPRSCATMRDSAASSQASPARSSGWIGDSKPGKALRISSGFFCQ